MTEGYKRWWESKGVWGGISTIVVGVAGLMGVVIDGAALADAMGTIASSFAVVVTGLLALVGRLNADKRIG